MSSRTLNVTDRIYDYLTTHALRENDAQKRLRMETAKLPMARMQISPEQGQFMSLLVRLMGAKKTLEVGVFTGYSSLCIALALPEGGKHVACDVSEEWTSIGRRFWQEAGVASKIDLHLAPALPTLDALLANGEAGTFDFAFIDADKLGYDAYYECALKLVRPGGLIAIDNVLWGGSVADLSDQDADTRAIRELNDKIHQDPRVEMSLLPIGDGVTLALKR
ncbi:putative O-methyltransferase [compost metagenome]